MARSKPIGMSVIGFVLVLLIVPFALAFDPTQYAYYKEIQILKGQSGTILFPIDNQVLSVMKSDGSDLRIVHNGEEIPAKYVVSPSDELARKSTISQVSSVLDSFRNEDFGAENIVDGDYTLSSGAYYQSDPAVDPISAWFIVRLPSKMPTESITLWTSDAEFTWEAIQIEGSDDAQTWSTIKPKKEYVHSPQRSVPYTPSQYQYLKVTLWHTQSVILNEIEILGSFSAQAVFSAESGKSYRLYYGNAQAQAPNYGTLSLPTSKSTPKATLSGQNANAQYTIDSDGDGVVADNCPTASNQDQQDSDNDGIGSVCDNCQSAPNAAQDDSDGDGVGNSCDNCPSIPNADQYDDNLNGRGYHCDDNDNDGVQNTQDNCLETPNPPQNDADRNGVGDSCEDLDLDGIPTSKDNCLSKANADQADRDADNIGDACDNCLNGQNRNQFDKDDDGIGDACEDADSDSIEDYRDNCNSFANIGQEDTDSDGRGDACDNCPSTKNPDQADGDNNQKGDICDDADSDGMINPLDNCPSVRNADQKDQNNNAVGDACEDFDSDGVMNAEDNCPHGHNPLSPMGNSWEQPDKDSDGLGDACDESDDRITEKKGLVWGVIVIAILIVAAMAFRILRDPLK